MDYTFTLADGGIHTFDNAILFERPSFKHPSFPSVNEWWVTVVDQAQPSKYGSQVKIEVLKRPITITAHNQTKQYYGETYDLGSTEFTVTSGITEYQNPDVFAGTEGISNVTLTSTGTAATALAGDYPLKPSSVVGINDFNEEYYDITFVSGTLSVDPRPITITVEANQSKTYGDADPSGYNYTVTEGSLASGDVFSGNLTREAGEDVGLYEVYQTGLTITEGATDKTNNYDITFVNDNKFEITKRDLSLSNFIADNKVYDGNTDVLSGDGFDDDRVAGDVLTFAYDVAFDNKNVGVAKDVDFTSIAISGGDDKDNYNLVTISGTANADITKRDLSLSNFIADNKVYDGNTDVLSGDGFDDDRVAGDVLTFAYDVAFDNKNVGVAKDVDFTSIAISGGVDKDNYNLVTISGTANADITKRDLSLSNFIADNKVYDGNTDVLSGDGFDDDRVAGDVLTFAYDVAFDNKNMGVAKDVDFSSIAISGGADKDNYNLVTISGTANADITKRDLSLSNFIADNKVYDGNTDVLSGDGFDDDRVAGDVLTFAYDVAFDNKNVGVAKDVDFSSIVISGGDDKDNYNLVTISGTANADITKRDLSLSNFVADNKVYDGNTDVLSGDGFDDDRVAGDVLTFAYDVAFDNKNVGVAKDVDFTSIAISGGVDKDNYNLVTISGTANADITKRDLSLSNFIADNKVYDGNTDILSGDGFDDDRVAGDVLTFAYDVAFDNKNVGVAKDVDFSSIAISGGVDKDNYNLVTISGTANADITKRDLSLSNFIAANKVYDGNTDVLSGDGFDDDRVAGDVLTFAYDVAFDNKNMGVAKDVDFTSIAISGGADKDNYNLVTVSGTANADITKRDLSLSNFVADNKVYDGNTDVLSGDGFDDDRVAGDVLTFAYDVAFDNKNVGVAKDVDFTSIAISGGADKDNYNLVTISGTANADITKRDLSLSNFIADNKVYDGNTDVLSGDGFDDDRVAGDVLTFAYDVAFDNKNVGVAKDVDFTSIAISGGVDKDNYNLVTISGTANADITKRDLSLSNFIADNKVYDGNTDILSGDGFDDDRVAGDVLTFAYDVAFDNKNMGVAKDVDFSSIAISGGVDKDNYNLVTISGTANADITKRDLSLSNFIADNKVYDGNTDVLSGDGFDDDRVAGDVLTFAYDVAFDNKNVGVAKDVDFTSIAISGGVDKDNYNLVTISGTANADITKRDLSLSNFIADNKVYDGNTDILSGDGFYDDRVAGDVLTFAYDVAFDNKNVGVAKDVDFTSIAISGGVDKDNYNLVTVSGTANADITKRDLSLSNFIADNKVYDGNTDVLSGDGFDDDRVAGDVLTFAYDVAFDNKNVGVAKDVDFTSIAISGGVDKDNYNLVTISGTANADITKRDLSLSNFVADNKVYDGNTDVLSGDGFYDDRVAGDVLTFAYDVAFDNKNVGVAKDVDFTSIAISGGDDKDNYNLVTISGTANADITPLDVTVTANSDQSKIYGETDPVFSYTSVPELGSKLTDTEVIEFTGELSRDANENVGVYEITQGTLDNINYNITFVSNTFEITKRRVAVAADAYQTKTYGDLDPVFTYASNPVLGSTLPNNEVVHFSGELIRVEGEDVGFYAIEQGTLDNSNYEITFVSNDFEITPLDVTVTADADQSKTYGDIDPVYEYTSIPAVGATLANGEIIGFAGELDREAGEDVGEYAIAQGSLNNSNYSINYVADNFEITPLNVTVTANAGQSKTYGDFDPVFEYTSIPAVGATLPNSEVVDFSGELNRSGGEEVGLYAIGQGTLANPNYSINFITDNFEITQLEVTVTADAGQSKTYGELDPVFEYTSTPAVGATLANNEVVGFAGTLDREAGEDVGEYAIGQGSLNNPNYSINYVADNFEITPLDVTVTADADQSKTYGDIDPVFEYTSVPAVGATLANSEVIGFAGVLDRDAGEDVGEYAIGQGSLNNSNYSINYVANNFEITPLDVTVTAIAGQSKTYGEFDPVFEYTSMPAVGATLANNEVIDFAGALDREAGEDVGEYAIGQGSLNNSNYSINYVANNFEITPLDVTVTADAGQNKTYGDLDPVFEYTSMPAVGATLANGEVIGFAGVLDREAGQDVGEYAIGQGSLNNSNYSINYVANNFEITPLDVTVTADADQSKTYGDLDPVFEYTSMPAIGATLANGEAIGFAGELDRAAGEDVGEYSIGQGSLNNPNYSINYVADNFEITQLDVTVTVDAGQSKTYGEADPEVFTYTSNPELGSTLANMETIGFTGELNRVEGENVGSYEINLGTLSNSNYNIDFVSNIFEITTKALTISAEDKTKEYDGEVFSPFTVSYDGFVGNEDESHLEGTLTFSGSAAGAINVGTDYVIKPEGLTSNNYAITFADGVLDITTKALTITADDKSKVYDGDVYSPFTVSYNGFAGNEDESVLEGTLTFGGTASEAIDPGTDYVITPEGYTSSNYEITFVSGSLTIIPRIVGDTNGDGEIGNGEMAGDINGDGIISDNEISGDTDGDGVIGNGETAGDTNGDGIIDGGEIAGDTDGDGVIDENELAGDTNGDGLIGESEIAGDTDGNGSISEPEIVGDNNGDGQITDSEIAGDANGDGIIGTGEAILLDPNKDHMNIMKLFTPNNDGFNDYWKISNILELGRVHVKIYDRWGTLIYESREYQNDWDGTSKGKPVAEGGYIYHVKTERAGTMTGVVNLVR